MRFNKYLSSVLLIILIVGSVINTSSLNNIGMGKNIYAEYFDNVGTLKNDIDERIQLKEETSILDSEAFKLVEVAYREVGNVGGEKFWSWYGFNSYQPWCACFVSWCADQCGFIESGIIPKFSLVSYGANWFMNNKQWLKRYETPEPGMLIFFDFVDRGLNEVSDGIADHVGIVKTVKDGYVYCIEGNYKNTCSEAKYKIGYGHILGYGVPNYK